MAWRKIPTARQEKIALDCMWSISKKFAYRFRLLVCLITVCLFFCWRYLCSKSLYSWNEMCSRCNEQAANVSSAILSILIFHYKKMHTHTQMCHQHFDENVNQMAINDVGSIKINISTSTSLTKINILRRKISIIWDFITISFKMFGDYFCVCFIFVYFWAAAFSISRSLFLTSIHLSAFPQSHIRTFFICIASTALNQRNCGGALLSFSTLSLSHSHKHKHREWNLYYSKINGFKQRLGAKVRLFRLFTVCNG